MAARAAAFSDSRQASTAASAAARPSPATDPPPGLAAFSVRVLASPGRAVYGRLAVPAVRAAEICESMLAPPPRRAMEEAAIRSVLALALYTRWLGERDDRYLAPSIDQLRCAIDSVVAGFVAASRGQRASMEQANGTDASATARFRGQLGILGVIPWHAARTGIRSHPRYACSAALFTTCASARQLIDAAARDRLPVNACSAVLVVNPDERLGRGEEEVDGIRSAIYAEGVCLGKSGHPAGGPSEVLACLSASDLPAVLHLGCHAMAADTLEESRLKLSGGDLPVSRILDRARIRKSGSPGGLIVLAACTSDLTLAAYDEALTLSSAFIAAGAIGVNGGRWEVDDLFTALLMFMLHRHLVQNPDQSAAEALRAAQLWMLDPRPEIPAEMQASLAAQARRRAVSSPFAWAAFTYQGQ